MWGRPTPCTRRCASTGGHANHSAFWAALAPAGAGGGTRPAPLARRWTRSWGGGGRPVGHDGGHGGVQGSGWGWLAVLPGGRLAVSTSANQDAVAAGTPLLGIDIWEHAFYLQYKNDKMAYLNAIWDVVNWKEVGARYDAAMAGGSKA
eukprot:TRINITY_DN7813_c0_g1_i1.p3 TRINITY_DN7813_c0_g1~~TRINITY_DN7813_c0_g1_i1.p3  ORF type:complete len:148 (+),score=41.98 TRINITY_DN7813_c0_g1_i1:112-555(+)